MIDLHTHSLLSDGAFLPEELVRRCEERGYRMLVIADHIGLSNADEVVRQLRRLCLALRGRSGIQVLPGAEITHVRPDLIPQAVRLARSAGAMIVIGHGQTLVEPVSPGTNRAFIEAGVDLLAHPGLITTEEAALAAKRGVLLEISGRKGHSFANGHVAQMARLTGAKLAFGSDGHESADYPTREMAEAIALGAGMKPEEIRRMFNNAEQLFRARAQNFGARSGSSTSRRLQGKSTRAKQKKGTS